MYRRRLISKYKKAARKRGDEYWKLQQQQQQ
jgi:hypothetical protein